MKQIDENGPVRFVIAITVIAVIVGCVCYVIASL